MTVFVDTNVLVYAHDSADRQKATAGIAFLTELWAVGNGAVSTQVLQEFYNVATGKLRPPMSAVEARQVVADYAEWTVVETSPQLILSATFLHERDQVSFRNALIVEAALLAGADTLLTEDLQHGQQFGTLTVRNPFLTD